MEQYYECLVKRGRNIVASLLSLLLGILTMVMLLASFLYTPLAMLLAIVMAVLTWLVYGRSQVEYEYLILEGEIGIDVIYNRKKRKHLGEYDLKSVCLFAPEGAGQLYNYREHPLRNYSSGSPEDKHYVMVSRNGGDTVLVKLTPDERMLSLVRQLLPVGAFVR